MAEKKTVYIRAQIKTFLLEYCQDISCENKKKTNPISDLVIGSMTESLYSLFHLFYLKITSFGDGKESQLRELAALPKDLMSLPSMHVKQLTTCNSSFRGSSDPDFSCQPSCTQTHTDTHA